VPILSPGVPLQGLEYVNEQVTPQVQTLQSGTFQGYFHVAILATWDLIWTMELPRWVYHQSGPGQRKQVWNAGASPVMGSYSNPLLAHTNSSLHNPSFLFCTTPLPPRALFPSPNFGAPQVMSFHVDGRVGAPVASSYLHVALPLALSLLQE
jgi:hypothetical protein